MALYDVYAECGANDRLIRVYSFSAPDDLSACEFVNARLTDTPTELWCRSMRVARFDRKRDLGPASPNSERPS
jgi:hypothetical protein